MIIYNKFEFAMESSLMVTPTFKCDFTMKITLFPQVCFYLDYKQPVDGQIKGIKKSVGVYLRVT